jgi:hypothetical protein
MRSTSRRHLVRLGIGAALLLSVLGAFTPRPAHAGCDHPFGVGIRNAWSAAQLDPLITGGSRTSLEGKRPGSSGRELPCSGPSCSGRVPMPTQAAPSVVQTLDDWCLLPGLFDLSPPGAEACRDGERLSHLPAVPSRIFHPPRFMA